MTRQAKLLACCCFPLLLGADERPAWQRYSPPDRNFTVLFPEQPTEEDVPNPLGTARAISAAAGEEGLIFMVLYHNLKESMNTRKSADSFLKGAEDGFLKSGARKTKPSRSIMLGLVPGVEIVGDGFQNHCVRSRAYVVRNRAYQVMVLSEDPGKLESVEAARFLDSFQILNLPAKPFDAGESSDPAYLLGKAIGYLLIVGGIVYVLTRRRKRSTPALE